MLAIEKHFAKTANAKTENLLEFHAVFLTGRVDGTNHYFVPYLLYYTTKAKAIFQVAVSMITFTFETALNLINIPLRNYLSYLFLQIYLYVPSN